MAERIIEFEDWRKQQLAIVGFVYHEGSKYYLRERLDKKVDLNAVKLAAGEMLATNGNCHLILTTNQANAKRVDISIKKYA